MNIYGDSHGGLWLASGRSGLIRIDDSTAEHPVFKSYTITEGLSSNSIDVITEDLRGHIYLGTGRGLDELDPATGGVKHFTTADGLASGGFSSAFRDQSGALWFGMSKGLSRFVPAGNQPLTPPPIWIASLSVPGLNHHLISAVGEREVTLPDLAPGQNQLQIEFGGLSFAPGEVLRYQYKLEGADTDWGAPTKQRAVTYPNLARGTYRFLVRAINADGQVSLAPAVITFRVLPPVWLRWWFITLVGLTVAGMVYTLYRYRVKRLLEMTNMRTRIATDLHDDIGANLTRIALLSEVAKQQLGADQYIKANGSRATHDNGQQDTPLTSIARIARESVGSMNDIVWAIDPKRDSLLDLTRKMRQHADELFTLRDIDLEFKAPDAKESLKLGADVRRDLLLIFKEAVNNAARHSQCSRVQIDFRIEGTALVLDIADNGIGFDPSTDSQGQGLRSMKRRAAAVGGNLQIDSEPGRQTRVSLSLPLARMRGLF
jgi:two-component sensor histidine kinase